MFQLEIVLSWSSPPFYDTEIALTSSVDSFTSWTIYNDCLSTDIRVMLVCILVIMISLLLPKLSGRVLRSECVEAEYGDIKIFILNIKLYMSLM